MDMADNVEVLPPSGDGKEIDIEKLRALIAEGGKAWLELQRVTEEGNTKRLAMQHSHQFRTTALMTTIVALTIGIAGFFGYRFIEVGKYDFVERIVVLLIGLAIGFYSGRQVGR